MGERELQISDLQAFCSEIIGLVASNVSVKIPSIDFKAAFTFKQTRNICTKV